MARLRRTPAVCLSLLLLPALLAAQEAPKTKKYALLVGVNEYEHDKLKKLQFAVNDVHEMAGVLGKSGYEVTVLSDQAGKDKDGLKPTKANIEREMKAVLGKTRKGDLLLLCFAGHGVQFEDQRDCFFCPTDARPFKDRSDSLVSLTKVYQEMEQSFAGMKVLLVDACRDDPETTRGTRSGINADNTPRPPQGVAALFSCRAGEMAREHEKLKHGVFFHHVLQGLKGEARDRKGNVTFAGLASYVNQEVPGWVSKNVGEGAKQSPNLKADYSTEPVLLNLPEDPSKPPDMVIGQPVKGTPGPRHVLDLGGVKMEFAFVGKGKFWMGSPFAEPERNKLHEPQTEVKIIHDFYLGVFEVTQDQWMTLMGTNPSWFSRRGGGQFKVKDISDDDLKLFPVENVAWDDAQEFLKRLNAREKNTGWVYRLPTEAEWEYACRGGHLTQTEGKQTAPFYLAKPSFTLSDRQANFDGRKPYGDTAVGVWMGRTCKVGSYEANILGLHDMHGNVSEWCDDASRGSPGYMTRGGGHSSQGSYLRAALPIKQMPKSRMSILGFRVARVPVAPR